MQKRKTLRKLVRNRRTAKKRIRATLDHGGMPSRSRTVESICKPIQAFTELAKYVKYPHSATLQPYNSAGCDLYIDIRQKPHIHIHGYSPREGIHGTYYYSISGKGIRNRAVPLLSKTEPGYQSVLVEMYNALDGKTRELPAFFSPSRSTTSYSLSISQRPTKSRVPRGIPLPGVIGDSRRKLGPSMGEYASITHE
jgi:hypothetical protein